MVIIIKLSLNVSRLFCVILILSTLPYEVGEKYVAMERTFLYNAELVTKARLLTCSAMAWLFSRILHIPVIDRAIFSLTYDVFSGLCISFIIIISAKSRSTVKFDDAKSNFQLSKLRKNKAEI